MMRLLRGKDNSSDNHSPQPFSPSLTAAPSVSGPKPIRLVYCDEKGKFRMDSEAVAALQLVKGPVGVISICGRARQGKSFVLNQLLGRSSGFQVASTHRPCTNGLWLWSAPLKRTTPDGTEVNLLFLDSEGIDAWDQKDFCLSLVENGVRLKLNEYLELALSQIPGSAEDIVAKKKIRDSIQDIFPDRQCFTLVRPTDNLIDLQGGVDEIELDQLSAEFRSGLDALKEFIFERTRPKEIGETMMTGPLLIDVITSYLDAINNGAVSTISSPWEDYRRSVYLEADLQCLNLIQRMEKSLRDASDASDANMDDIVKVLEALLLEYKASSHGPGKWQLLAVFLQQSLEGPMVHLTKKLIEKANSGMQSLSDAMKSQPEWVENMENSQSEALARFTDPMRRRIVVQEKLLDSITSLKEQNIELSHTLDSTKKESSRWKRKYEEAQSAQEEAEEWQSKYNDATTDAKSKLAKADVELQDTIKKANEKESDMRGRFSLQMAEKDEEIKNKKERLEYVGQRLEAITSKSAVSELEEKYESLEREIETLKQDKVHLEGTCKSFEREVEILQQDKDNLEEQCKSKSEQIDEVLTRVSFLQDEVKRATDEVAKVQTDAYIGKQLEAKRLAEVERAAAEEATRAVGEIKILEAQRNYLEKKLETSRASHAEASRHAASLMAEDEERKREIESIQASKTEKMTSYAKVIENLVSKRGDLLAFVKLAEELSHELQDAHAKIDNLYPGLIRVGLNETAAVDEVQAGFRQKRPREDDIQMGEGSGQEMDTGVRLGGNKKHRITPSPPSPQTDRHAEDGGSMRGENNS